MSRTIRIGNGCGFWGDNLDAPILLAEQGRLDYLTLEYLAELTMSILALQKQRDPQLGYATDFLDVLDRLCPILQRQPRLKIITNAGGMNPKACAAKARAILRNAGLGSVPIATVSGDDLMPVHGIVEERIRDRVVSANAYLGAGPIVEALRLGASIVITGRVADASLTLAPCVHEFGWPWDDWDRLCAGTVAGHLIECGAQVTGGLWCNWQEAGDLANVGYPIAEVEESGLVRITKPERTAGAVNFETVSEQLLYEVEDPRAYLTPDVTADFTSVALREKSSDVVEINGASGKPATDTYKVSIAYRDGYTASGMLGIYGPDCIDKAQECAMILLSRLQRAGLTLEETSIELLGAGALVPLRGPDEEQVWREIVLRVAVHDSRRGVVERFTKEFAPLVTSGPPGVTGYAGGRPPVREVLAYYPALTKKDLVRPMVTLES